MSKSISRRILQEAPIDYGGQPDFIDPEKKRQIEGGGHPYGEDFPSDVAASQVYPEIMRKIQRYTGVQPRGRRDAMGLMMQMQQAVMTAMQIEAGHEEELQNAAINLVLDLAEFRGARAAVDRGDLKIIAELTPEVELSRAHLEPQPDDPQNMDLQVPQIKQELDIAIQKRRFVNMMIQGCLPETALVLTSSGYKPLSDFETETVWTGNEWAFAKKIAMGADYFVKVTLSNGYVFECDTRHKLLCYVKAWPEWLSIKDTVGAALAHSAYPALAGNKQCEDKEFWYWIGRYYGDGHIQYTRKTGTKIRKNSDLFCEEGKSSRANIHWCFGKDEEQDFLKCQAYWKSRGVKSSVNSQSRDDKLSKFNLRLHSASLIRKWREYGILPNQKSWNKRLPVCVYSLDESRRKALYTGYYDADGTKAKQHQITSVCRELLQDFQLIGRTLNMPLEIKGPYVNDTDRVFYRLVFSDEFRDKVLRVRSVEISAVKKPMFTLMVDSDTHSFDSEGLISKNSAINKNHAYHMADHELNAIDPRLLNLYGTAMSLGELAYWAIPSDVWKNMMRNGSAGGSVHLKTEEGVPTIRAQALIFPALVQELVKGLMEYLSHSEDEDPEIRRYVRGKADTLDAEQWDIMLGPGVWKRFADALGDGNQDLMPHVYDHLVRLPAEDFKRVIHGIIRGTPDGVQYIRDLVVKIRAETGEA